MQREMKQGHMFIRRCDSYMVILRSARALEPIRALGQMIILRAGESVK